MNFFPVTLIFSTLLFALSANGQSISGTWEGNYGKQLLVPQPLKLVVELQLYSDSLITGASHLYYKNDKYEHYKLRGKFSKSDSTIEFIEDSVIGIKFGFMVSACAGVYTMKLSFPDSVMKFTGKWKDKRTGIFKCPGSSVWLEKDILPDIGNSTLNKIGSTLTKDPDLDKTDDIQSLIEIDPAVTDSVKIEIFDNGEIDDDVISIYLNDSLVSHKAKISAKAASFYLKLDKSKPISKLKMSAESLGKIPPCTAVMIITINNKKHEISLSSDLRRNAVVEFFLKP